MAEIIVKSQKEFDEIPQDYNGRIYVEFGTTYNMAVINRVFEKAVVVLRGNSSAELRGNSSAVLRENSSAELWGNSQAVDVESKGNAITNGNSRVVYLPRNIEEYIKYYSLDSTDEYVTLYKAVHKSNGKYYSDYDKSFCYEIGKVADSPIFSKNVSQQCGSGLHLAHLVYALAFGKDWSDCAILECRAKKEDVVVPIPNQGKVRVPRCEVVREIPLEECGAYGKILAKWRANND